jgi:hypothetical protein
MTALFMLIQEPCILGLSTLNISRSAGATIFSCNETSLFCLKIGSYVVRKNIVCHTTWTSPYLIYRNYILVEFSRTVRLERYFQYRKISFAVKTTLQNEKLKTEMLTMIHGGIGVVVGWEVGTTHAPHMIMMVMILDLSMVPSVPAAGPLLHPWGVHPSRIHSHHGLSLTIPQCRHNNFFFNGCSYYSQTAFSFTYIHSLCVRKKALNIYPIVIDLLC